VFFFSPLKLRSEFITYLAEITEIDKTTAVIVCGNDNDRLIMELRREAYRN
jgi:hypothetical protein